MYKKLFTCMVITIFLIVGILYGCNTKDLETDTISVTGIELNTETEIMLINQTLSLSASILPDNATNTKLSWLSISEDVASVNEEGLVTAISSGITTISAISEDGNFAANAMIYVGDAIVNADFNQESEGYNISKFSDIKTAIDTLGENKIIIVMSGIYDEALSINKSINLVGVGYPELKSIVINADNKELNIKGLKFNNINYPAGGEATVKGSIDGSLYVEDCKFDINSEEVFSGGYAIYASNGSKKVTIKNCTINNYRYGIYSHQAGADFDITNNTFNNTKTGIGVDIRVINSNPPINKAAFGEIKDNVYNTVTTNAEFYFNGETYDGNLNFADYQS